MTIFTRFAAGNLNVSSGTAVAFQRTPSVTAAAGEVTAGKRESASHSDPERTNSLFLPLPKRINVTVASEKRGFAG
jgi:hypothetical protein